MVRHTDTRQHLLDAARLLLWEQSYAATSVDAICERAGVGKGSFYHFFASKCALATAAILQHHTRERAKLDAAFSPVVPPLDRFRRHFENTYEEQSSLKATTGRVLGCPVFTLGVETCGADSSLRDTIEQILDEHLAYYTSAIHAAAMEGLVAACEPTHKAAGLFALAQGTLTRARIRNDPEILRDLYGHALDYLHAVRAMAIA